MRMGIQSPIRMPFSLVPAAQLTMLSAVRGQVPNPDENAFNDIPDVAFRYSSGIWIFNMATSNLQQNTTYTFRINLANGQGITFVIKIK